MGIFASKEPASAAACARTMLISKCSPEVSSKGSVYPCKCNDIASRELIKDFRRWGAQKEYWPVLKKPMRELELFQMYFNLALNYCSPNGIEALKYNSLLNITPSKKERPLGTEAPSPPSPVEELYYWGPCQGP